ncbi:hypothetical protein PSPPH_4412 [Pseudomonas savastanoi pv. phaseolicola 1448A]|uniref:Uncharacterized protein n=1 Tax=Pseudomonas savastanoi pv. phaseolicola (strain 1448A / Race 6) TaxID=264730 RepID=Q48DL3_PSE14|nr:hypothetical protein PSPPH_4412 [Pseudomonas savastanoi pv. phaseolicola 1448A]
MPHERQRRQADGRYQCADLLRRPMPIPLSPHRYIQSPLWILAESRRSGLVRERAVTSAGDVSPEIKLSRTSSLPRPAGRSLNATIYHAQPSSLYTSPLWILAESRRSGLVRERAVTSAGGVLPEIKLSRTSSLPRPAGRSLNATIYHAQPSSLYTSPLLILAESRRSGLVREGAVTSAGDVSPEIKLSRTSSLPRPAGRSLNATIYHAQPSSLYTSPLLILAESRRSGLVREGAVTSAGDVSPEIKPSRTSSLPRPAGRSLNTPIFRALQDLCITMSAQPARPLDQRRRETHAQNALMG